jgi:hypothetical protein
MISISYVTKVIFGLKFKVVRDFFDYLSLITLEEVSCTASTFLVKIANVAKSKTLELIFKTK